jgi:hypothetical protein
MCLQGCAGEPALVDLRVLEQYVISVTYAVAEEWHALSFACRFLGAQPPGHASGLG